jgi:radical SAM protein with 4Fe4S-binding SPASM domain
MPLESSRESLRERLQRPLKRVLRTYRDRFFRRSPDRFRYDLADKGRTLMIRMDVINRCNMRCFMCPYPCIVEEGHPTEVMSPALYERIAEQVFGCCYHLSLSCAYEPLLHPKFADLAAITSRFDIPEWGIVTNGTLLDERMAAALIESQMHVLSISIDGATAETYRGIRGVDAFEKVLANARQLQEMKRAAGSDKPHLFSNFVLMRRNLGEVLAYLDLCARLGVEDVTFVHVAPRLRENAESLLHEPRRYVDVYAQAKERAGALGLRVLLPAPFSPEELGRESPAHHERRLQETHADDLEGTGVGVAPVPIEGAGDDLFCASPWMMIFIAPNGDVHPCSHRQNDAAFGNLGQSSFEEIWNGPAFLELRRRLYYHDLEGRCLTCESTTPNNEPMVRRPVRIFPASVGS